jgi:hypothetical protein
MIGGYYSGDSVGNLISNLVQIFIMTVLGDYLNTTKYDNLRYPLSMLISVAVFSIYQLITKSKFLTYFQQTSSKIQISRLIPGDGGGWTLNPFYLKMEDYIIENFIKDIDRMDIKHRQGEFMYSLKSIRESVITFEGEKIYFSLILEGDSMKENNSVLGLNLMIYKKNKFDVLKRFLKFVNELPKQKTSTINVFKHNKAFTSEEGYDDDDEDRSGGGKRKSSNTTVSVEWEKYKFKTNKSKNNTILTKETHQNFYDDVTKFLSESSEYARRGEPYTRGILLHGPPGCGKTSAIKAVASDDNLDIFVFNLNNLSNDSQVDALSDSIPKYLSGNNEKYILLMEDFDRCFLFNEDRHQRRPNGWKVSEACILNMLNGVSEAYGRLTLMTANNPEIFTSHTALMRPGRVDNIVHVGKCDTSQVLGFLRLYYGDKFEWNEEEMKITTEGSSIVLKKEVDITPAVLINLIKKNESDIVKTVEFLNNTLSNKEKGGDNEGGGGGFSSLEHERAKRQSRRSRRGWRNIRCITVADYTRKIKLIEKEISEEFIEKQKLFLEKLKNKQEQLKEVTKTQKSVRKEKRQLTQRKNLELPKKMK